jgi:capsular exopolysaccharide synthesis family protein
LVCFLIALAEARLKRIVSVDDVAGKLRVMGQVPAIPAWASRSPRAAKSKKGRFWHDMLAESVDAARTLLVHDAEQEDARVIMVSSAMPSEGKTTLSCHIASSLARAGRKVVLVDCDLRRPNVHRVFNLPNEAGFCEVVLGKKGLDEVIQTGVPGGPAILSAGHLTPSVSPLLGMEATEQVFRGLKERFEFVVVDSSPVMIVHDTLVMAQHVDAVIIAVRKHVSRQPKVAALIDRLQSLEVPVLGTVTIGLESEAQDYRSGYYQGYSKYYATKRAR